MNSIFQFLARFVASSPKVVSAIKSYGFARPYRHLVHKDGVPYMSRYWLMPKWMLEPDELGDPVPKKWVPLKIRLHHIHTEDYDRKYHDHPADYRTFIMEGWYVESDLFGVARLFGAGTTRCARAETFHKITEVSPGGLFTIFIMGKKRLEWGFIVNDQKVHWRDYEGE